jgi:hypothetical protein
VGTRLEDDQVAAAAPFGIDSPAGPLARFELYNSIRKLLRFRVIFREPSYDRRFDSFDPGRACDVWLEHTALETEARVEGDPPSFLP